MTEWSNQEPQNNHEEVYPNPQTLDFSTESAGELGFLNLKPKIREAVYLAETGQLNAFRDLVGELKNTPEGRAALIEIFVHLQLAKQKHPQNDKRVINLLNSAIKILKTEIDRPKDVLGRINQFLEEPIRTNNKELLVCFIATYMGYLLVGSVANKLVEVIGTTVYGIPTVERGEGAKSVPVIIPAAPDTFDPKMYGAILQADFSTLNIEISSRGEVSCVVDESQMGQLKRLENQLRDKYTIYETEIDGRIHFLAIPHPVQPKDSALLENPKIDIETLRAQLTVMEELYPGIKFSILDGNMIVANVEGEITEEKMRLLRRLAETHLYNVMEDSQGNPTGAFLTF